MANVEASRIANEAVRSFLRGSTFPGLARGVAWRAVRATGASQSALEWLTPLVSRPLGDGLEGLEFQVDRACVRAREEHLRAWPYDTVGAELAGRAAGEEEAVSALRELHDAAVAWATELLEERLRAA